MTGPTFGLSKAAIIFLYLRVFKPHRWLRHSCYALLFTTLVFWVNIPLSLAFCTPQNGESWNMVTLTRCGAKLALVGAVQGAFSIFQDLLLLVLPLPIIWELHLSTRKKIALSAVFLFGLL